MQNFIPAKVTIFNKTYPIVDKICKVKINKIDFPNRLNNLIILEPNNRNKIFEVLCYIKKCTLPHVDALIMNELRSQYIGYITFIKGA